MKESLASLSITFDPFIKSILDKNVDIVLLDGVIRNDGILLNGVPLVY